MNSPSTIELSLISHTNAGKTTLARTLLGRDIGEVRDAPHVTEIAEAHSLLDTPEGDLLRLWDTPGFGDSTRLVKRLTQSANPVGWFLREVWDRFKDRPLWCSQQAMRAARESSDVVLYLVNAAENPSDAGYVAPEMQILKWVGKPVLVLLNQVGPPRPPAEEEAEEARWRSHVAPFDVVRDVITLDAFARCWVQERVLLDHVRALVPAEKGPALDRLIAAWERVSVGRFHASMQVLAQQLVAAARDREPIAVVAPASTAEKLLRTIGVGRRGDEAARDGAMQALADRLDATIRGATDKLIALHGLDGKAAAVVLERMRTNFSMNERVDEGRAALWGGVVSGALSGLATDLAAGGFTFGAGMLAGGVLGAFGAAGLARGYNMARGADEPAVSWSPTFLDGLTRAALLRYLAVAHFGRGRGKYQEGEAPAFWQEEVTELVLARAAQFTALWVAADETDAVQLENDLEQTLVETGRALLDRLYPGRVPLVVSTGIRAEHGVSS
ncbi:MAG: DUF3482 domain-containing protein [Burkholderiales bacterium]